MPPVTELFRGAELKVEWANKHILDLEKVIGAYLETNTIALSPNVDPQHGEDGIQFDLPTQPLPRQVPLIIGDAVHNLRSALDYMYYDIVVPLGGNPNWVRLPCCKDRKTLKDALKGGPIKAHPDIYNFILNDVQPYKGGDTPVWSLDELDNRDKHRLLIVTPSRAALRNVEATGRGVLMSRFLFVHQGTGREMNIQRLNLFPGTKDIQFKQKGYATFDIIFGKGQPLKGESVIPTLNYLVQVVIAIIEKAKIVVRKP